jgi:hypothetical protein
VNNAGSTIWHGTVSFFLCKVDSPGLCTTGGTAVNGGTPLVNQPVPVDNDPATANTTTTALSSAATVTSAGRYCWRAVFSGDPSASVGSSSDSSATECFTVNPVTPTLPTTAGDDVTLGNAVTDSAVLAGTATQPTNPPINLTNTGGAAAGGTITFKLYGPNNCTTLAYTSPTVAVSGDGTYSTPAPQFVPTEAGTYHWVADYSGNLPNTNPATHNAACTDTNEDVVVNQQNSTVSSEQNWLPNDTATVNHAGNVTFTLFKNGSVTDSHTCSVGTGTQILTQTVAATGSGTTFTASTTNTTNKVTSVTANDTYTWKIEVPASGAFKAVTSCVEATQFNSLNNGGTVTST